MFETENPQTSRTARIAAVIVATGLLIGAGVAYRVAAEYLARPPEGPRIARGTLDRKLPLQIGNWRGENVPLDDAIIRATDTDDHVNRSYTRRIGTFEKVDMFVAYGMRARDLMPHRPEVCYPGAGWTLRNTDDLDLALDNGRTLPCRVYRFARAGLARDSITVLNYYIVDGQYCPHADALRAKALRGGEVHYLAQVQVTCPVSALRTSHDVQESVRQFAIDSASHIYELFADLPGASQSAEHPPPTGTQETGRGQD